MGKVLTGIKIVGFRHFNLGPGFFLNLCDGLAAFANDGTGSDGWHKNFEVNIVAWKELVVRVRNQRAFREPKLQEIRLIIL